MHCADAGPAPRRADCRLMATAAAVCGNSLFSAGSFVGGRRQPAAQGAAAPAAARRSAGVAAVLEQGRGEAVALQ
jgi:hypothetical protein